MGLAMLKNFEAQKRVGGGWEKPGKMKRIEQKNPQATAMGTELKTKGKKIEDMECTKKKAQQKGR